jgi:hypothetical protein
MFAHQAESQETTNIYYNFSTSSSTGSALKDENVLLGNANDENIFK